MKSNSSVMRRPARWDQPFDSNMDSSKVQELLCIEPFNQMDGSKFPLRLPLDGILLNDCRWRSCEPGQIILREGDYGSSAFLVLSGSVLVSLQRLENQVLGRREEKKKSVLQAFSQWWNNPQVAEVRAIDSKTDLLRTQPDSKGDTQVFVQDLSRLITPGQSALINQGEIFGELAALTRTPRTATVIANTECQLLEIRWQGLRDMQKFDSALKRHVDQLYRQNSLQDQLRNTPLLSKLDDQIIESIAAETTFGSWGNHDWNHQFRRTQQNQNSAEKILQEPVIIGEDDYINGLVLIRNGFARLSQRYGEGHRTIAYLGKGQGFGLRELYHNWKTKDQSSSLLSLRAVGYVDTLTIPTHLVEKWILPVLKKDEVPPPIVKANDVQVRERRQESRDQDIETGLLEFLVESRVINGTQAMLVDRDRCTRCDDCVRACATAHEGNPRFVRSGPVHDNWMIAQACMHCMDPVCMIGCPTGAIGRDEESGTVHINDSTCIGCGTCANSCPYQNIQMVPIRNEKQKPLTGADDQLPILKATKCDLCMEQLGGPACQRACPHDALVRIDLTSTGPLHEFLTG